MAVSPRGPKKGESSHDDEDGHGQEKRRPSTYVEETIKKFFFIFIFFLCRCEICKLVRYGGTMRTVYTKTHVEYDGDLKG